MLLEQKIEKIKVRNKLKELIGTKLEMYNMDNTKQLLDEIFEGEEDFVEIYGDWNGEDLLNDECDSRDFEG